MMRRTLSFFAATLMTSAVFSIGAFAAVSTNSTLSQAVEPITCVYTITELGESTSSSTACDSVIAPTLDTVEPRAGRPYLAGALTSTDLAMFRVWIGGVWFTNGVSTYLTVTADTWVLDLSALASPLDSGDYTIILEEQTTSDFLLRSVYPSALYIPRVEIIRTDTIVGNGTTSHYVSKWELGFFLGDQKLARSLVPDDKLIDESWGFTHYTTDTVMRKKDTPIQTILNILVPLAVIALFSYAVYIRFIRPRLNR